MQSQKLVQKSERNTFSFSSQTARGLECVHLFVGVGAVPALVARHVAGPVPARLPLEALRRRRRHPLLVDLDPKPRPVQARHRVGWPDARRLHGEDVRVPGVPAAGPARGQPSEI